MAEESGGLVQPGLKEYIEAGYPCLFLPTVEPEVATRRILKALEEVGDIKGRQSLLIKFGVWKVTKGLYTGTVGKPMELRKHERADDVLDALASMMQDDKETRYREPLMYVFHNVREFLKNAGVIQQMVDTILMARTTGSCVFLVGPYLDVPPELKSLITFVDCPLPTREQIQDGYKKIITAYEDDLWKEGEKPEEKEVDEILRGAATAAVGLDSMGAENALALSMATTGGIDLRVIQMQKEQEVKKSDVLEFIPTEESLDDVGGFSALKEWMRRRQPVFSDEAREFGLPYPKGVLLVGLPGCLTGDTRLCILRKRGGGGRYETLEALFYRFNGKHSEGVRNGVLSKHKRVWDSLHRTKIQSFKEKEGYLVYNDIEAVVYSGIKQVFQMETDVGCTIKATADHKFLTPDRGYVPLKELRVGDRIVGHGKGKLLEGNKTGRNKNIAPFQINNVGNHPNARRRVVNGLCYTSYPLATLVVESHLNGMPLEEFLFALHGNIETLKFVPDGMEVHHKDGNRRNNQLDNLEAMTKAEHAGWHMWMHGNPDKYKWMGRIQKIASIVLVGKKPTFDISMRAPYHSFLANGLVVHNSGKSLCAKAIASYLKLPCLRLDVGKVARSLYGESESAMRLALQVAEAVSPVVLWIEEIEKAFAGMSGSGNLDSGVTSRVIQTFLTWRQETKAPIFIAATANNVTNLPSMVYRRGRLDEVWATDLPDIEERIEIFSIHIKKREHPGNGMEVKRFDLQALAKATEDFTGAEIESCVEDAMFAAFDKKKKVEMDFILKSIDETVPQAKRDKEEVTAIREWVKTRARLVSGKDVEERPKIGFSAGSRTMKVKKKGD